MTNKNQQVGNIGLYYVAFSDFRNPPFRILVSVRISPFMKTMAAASAVIFPP
jgi:hypothetical protein